MIEDVSKKIYVPPRVVAVSFQVERGFQSSNGLFTELNLLPDSQDVRYGAAANSGSSFWGGNTSSESSTGSYNSWVWRW